MSEVTIFSSTDSQAAVDAAAELVKGDKLVEREAPAESEQSTEGERTDATEGPRKGRSSFEATKDWVGKPGSKAASTTDSLASVAETNADLKESDEEQKAAYLGHGARRRINALVRQKHELEAEVEALRSQRPAPTLSESESDNGAAPPDQAAGAPQLTREQLQAQYDQEMRIMEARVALPYREQAARAKYPDMDEVFQKTELPQWVIGELAIHADGHEVGYLIGKNPEIQQAIMRAHERADAASAQEIYNILNYVSTHVRFNPHSHQQGRERTRTIPTTPEPIRPLGGSSRSSADPSGMSYQDFKAWRNSGGGRSR